MPKRQKKIWVISGTHWDREWRYTADQSLLRLMELMDDLLSILEKHPEFKCFLLDGGTIVMEDYLAIRPENEERLRKLIAKGQIATVPWYTLPEMNIVAPEALIRNLIIGKRMVDHFGAQTKTGYTATSYGQISQMPQIYDGFGLKTALTYRGTNKHQVAPICNWQSPDGTSIYLIRCFDEVTRTNWFFFTHYMLVLNKLPRDLRPQYDPVNLPVHMADETMYEVGHQMTWESFDFNKDPQALRKALDILVKQAGPQAIGEHILALDMEDNATPYVNLPKLIGALNEVQDEYELVLDSIDNYTDAIVETVKDKSVPVHKGEMRYTAIEVGFNALLGTVQSSRMILKLLNNEAERDLIAVAEPLSSLSAMLGDQYRRSLLDRGWLDLLKNHAHDSICGAAINEAHKDMPTRFRATWALARECSRRSCEYIWSKLDTAKSFKEDDITLTFFNTTPVARKAVVPLILDTPMPRGESIYVEAVTGAGPVLDDAEEHKVVSYDYFDTLDEQGNKVAAKVLEKETTHVEAERKLDSNAISYKVVRHQMLMEVDVPPMGYRTYAIRPRPRNYIPDPKPAGDRLLIAQTGGVLENEYLKVQINPNGTFDLTDKKTGRQSKSLHYFEDNGSLGNAHQYRTPMRDFTVSSLGCSAAVTLEENNALRARYRIDIVLPIPADADLDGRHRNRFTIDLPISTWVTLKKGSPRLEIKTRFDNHSRDHRLRVMLPSDIKTNEVQVESAFDVVTRCFQWIQTADNFEGHYPYQPMYNFVDLTDGKNGFAFMSKGLREYEVVDDPRRTLAITLMRCHRAYMLARKDPMTPEELARNDGQHSVGEHEMEYAIMPHVGDWRKANVLNEANEFNTPWRIIQGLPKPGELPVSQSLISITPTEHVHLAAFYQSEDGKGYTLRLWNSSDAPVTATLSSTLKIKTVEKVRMDESQTLAKLTGTGKGWDIPLRQKEIATLKIMMA